jgi:Predicted nucleotide-binding protein containing TIR-like domain
MNALEQFDFGIMVLSPDDLLESRNERFASPRDNVVFELGLFMGRLGRSRTFIVHEKDANLKLPSDLAGISISPYRKRENMSAALGPTCFPIIKAIRSLGFFEGRATARFNRATDQMKKTNEQVDQLSILMARTRLLELEIVFSGFPGRISDEQRDKMGAQIQELRRLVDRKPT